MKMVILVLKNRWHRLSVINIYNNTATRCHELFHLFASSNNDYCTSNYYLLMKGFIYFQ